MEKKCYSYEYEIQGWDRSAPSPVEAESATEALDEAQCRLYFLNELGSFNFTVYIYDGGNLVIEERLRTALTD